MMEQDPELSQAYRAAEHPEPPTVLDARILAAACQAVVPQPKRRPAWFGWAVPLSSTAVLVLGISLLFRMQQEAPETLREAQSPQLPQLQQPVKPLERVQTTPPGVDAPAMPPAAKAAPAQTAPAPRQPVLPPSAPLSESAVADVAMEKSADSAGLVAPPTPALTRPLPAPAAAAANRAEASPAAPTFSQGMNRMKSAAPAAERATLAVSAKAVAPESETPEQWVEAIRLLLRQGNIDAARIRLEALRKRYPDFLLPPDLEPARCCPTP